MLKKNHHTTFSGPTILSLIVVPGVNLNSDSFVNIFDLYTSTFYLHDNRKGSSYTTIHFHSDGP